MTQVFPGFNIAPTDSDSEISKTKPTLFIYSFRSDNLWGCNMQDIRPKTKVPVGPRLVRKPDVLRCTYDGNLPTTKNPAATM